MKIEIIHSPRLSNLQNKVNAFLETHNNCGIQKIEPFSCSNFDGDYSNETNAVMIVYSEPLH